MDVGNEICLAIMGSIIGCLLGFLLNRAYRKRYGEAAIQWRPFAVQFVFAVGSLATFPGYGMSHWFVLWVMGLALSYFFGLRQCIKHAAEQRADRGYMACAIIAQAIPPLGLALAGLILFGMFALGILWAH
ncbi:hypothetical protein IJT17_05530 [bacterium]|nr:hypothetical protein [bacterium]